MIRFVTINMRGAWEIYQYDDAIPMDGAKDQFWATKYQWSDGNHRLFLNEEKCLEEIEKIKSNENSS